MEPLYLMIRDDLLNLIGNHTYHVGETIPSEAEIAETYRTSRPTVRRAIQLLVDASYLEKRPGKGAIVCAPKIHQGFAMNLRSFDEEMHLLHKIPRTKVLNNRRIATSDDVAAYLEIPKGVEFFKIVRLRYVDNMPNALVDSCVPLDLFPRIGEVDFSSTSMYAYFEKQGHPVFNATRCLEVLKADEKLSALLDVPLDDPLFRFTTVARTAEGRIAEYSVATYRGENNTFEFSTGAIRTGDSPSGQMSL